MSQLIDLTRCFKSTKVNWSLRGQTFAGQFKEHARPARGVYAHLDTNRSRLPVHDKNGPGKIIIFASTTALKFGKFESGLAGRMLQNYDHFHRRPVRGPHQNGVFPEVLTCLYVVDLGDRPKGSIRSIETGWNRSIRAELRRRDLVHPDHRGRAESINLVRGLTCSEVLSILEPIAAGI